MTAALGLGTYRVRAAGQAARTALPAGATWVDTAPNYGHGKAHHDLAPILAQYPDVRVATKTGFHTGAQRRAAFQAGLLSAEEAAHGHSLDPGFVRWQTEDSLGTLGRADIVFVHNPEHTAHHDGIGAATDQLRAAFAELEDLALQRAIGGYGVATWSGLSRGVFSVSGLLALACEAAGSPNHHFHGLQMPVSLVMADPIDLALRGGGPLVQARDAGVVTFGSAPLHGGELPDLMTPELVELIRPGRSAPAAALLAAASAPGLDVVLLSASSPGHWHDALTAVAEPLAADQLRRVIDVLAAG
ncbi:aldo/keto reductase [Kitasatospora sp. NPDC085879]|uniref:aldo/keto reductase n=1 Tax=Kitasatospora sp. NPDC085879 TaxID=3154769 RepID=UPI0034121890